ncbi:histone-lysine N-methyltransferase SETMAR-like [Stegodyphus dumicola]|uniref:histone-lysine N-methyltransferase SETMAR-like n=1 Tax=Stegodyphus dumicola TaxID=202533 RepID=UPI0015A88A40|nr:histone-lysine N-methyltransferase SETMAR-like [Stegodyphus dumicola]
MVLPTKKFLEKGKTLNSKMYSEMLVCADADIKEKFQTKFQHKNAIFHQDNARPHVSSFTGLTLYGLQWDLLPYSPDIAPSNLYLSSHLQLHLAGVIFHSAQDVRNEIDLFLGLTATKFLAEGFGKLPKL